MSIDQIQQALTVIATVVAAVVAAAAAARKVVGGPIAAKILQGQIAEGSMYAYRVVIVAATKLAAIDLRTVLVEHGFKTVRVTEPGDFKQSSDEVVVVVASDGFDHSTFAGEHALAEGLIYVKGRATPPPGDWSFANSRVSLHARLRELIEWCRASA